MWGSNIVNIRFTYRYHCGGNARLATARRECASDREYQTRGVDIIIALDISGSMLAEDFQPENRVFDAKQEAIKFIKGR